MADVTIEIVRATVAGGEARDIGETVTVSAKEAELLQRLGKAALSVAETEPKTATATPNAETATATPNAETATATPNAETATATPNTATPDAETATATPEPKKKKA